MMFETTRRKMVGVIGARGSAWRAPLKPRPRAEKGTAGTISAYSALNPCYNDVALLGVCHDT